MFAVKVSRQGDESIKETDGTANEIGPIKSMNDIFTRPSYQISLQGRVPAFLE